MSRSISIALLLITSGGFMDAFTFIAYGHVFTNAQSGNVVLLAVYAARLEWVQALKHVPPMLAFFPGVFAARWLAAKRPFGHRQRTKAVVVSVELAILVVLGVFGGVLSSSLVTFGIAFASAMQNGAFETVEGISYTSVVTTGNLRSTAEALFDGVYRKDAGAYRKARILGAISAAFAIGAMVGAILTWPLGRTAIACPILLVASALVLCLKKGVEGRGESSSQFGDSDH